MVSPYALIDGYMEGLLTDEQFAELVNWLQADPNNAEAFAVWTQTGQQIEEQYRKKDVAEALATEVLDPLQSVTDGADTPDTLLAASTSEANADWQRLLAEHPNGDKHSDMSASPHLSRHELFSLAGYVLGQALTSKLAYKAYGIAAAVLLAVTLFLVFGGGEDDATTDPLAGQHPVIDSQVDPPSVSATTVVATLTSERDASWDRQPGRQLYPGELYTLIDGFAEITTARGAVAILQAPASIELTDSDNALHLHAGKLVGLCHTSASKGFVVLTEHADITDLGTEFGVNVSSSQLTTTVFTGEVKLTAPGGMSQSLVANQTAEVRTQGTRREVVVEDRIAKGFDSLLRPAIVTAARINLNGHEVRIAPRGVFEDALLYTDRPHEINGIDASGIPAVLRGGDLVMMPTGARMIEAPQNKALRLELDLAGPADIYILYATGEAGGPMDWLTRDYESTGLTVGCDMGWGNRNETAAIGPGNSIDRTLSVWKRKAPANGTLTAAYESPGLAMYAVVVVPADPR